MSAASPALLATETVIRIGRKRASHLPRVLIEDNNVVLRTRCGIAVSSVDGTEAFTESGGIATCESCIESRDAS